MSIVRSARRASTPPGQMPRAWPAAFAALVLPAFCASAQGPANAPPKSATAPGGAPIVLLLPARGSRFGDAGDAVRRGFLAARQVAGDTSRVDVVETDESAAQLLPVLARARDHGAEVAVGPLTRDAVNAVADGDRDALPVVTLNYPERDTLPQSLLAFGFSIEQEARQVARAAVGAGDEGAATSIGPPRRLLIVGGRGPLERRMTDSFRRALVELGQQPEVIEPAFDASGLADFGAKIKDRAFDGVFLALAAREAALVRPRIRNATSLWATSQVNPGGQVAQALAGALSGVRFVDMPWLVEPDEPKVSAYPRLRADEGAQVPVDLERLYALGIDAYRLAKIWSTGSTRFEIAGVTGTLAVDRSRSGRVERFPVFAVFRAGRVQREEPAP